jgi:hypothetical protein
VTDFGLQAASYGSKTTGNATAHSDATALSVLGCTRYIPRSDSNFVAHSGDGDNVSLRNTTTHNFSGHSNGQTSVTSVVHIDGGSVAGGQVGFTNLTARVRTFHDAQGYHSKTLSSLGSLSVAGAPVTLPTNGRPMTVNVPGQGKLLLNHRESRTRASSATGAVNVMRFVGDDGTTEKVGRAFARIDGQVSGGLFHGSAWASDARVASAASSGRGALQPMPCIGTGGAVRQSSTGEGHFDYGFVGARRSFAYGVQRANGSATGYTRSHIDKARFGAGVLEFRNIQARANVTRPANGPVMRDAKGTGVGKILVAGRAIQQPAPGQARKVAGLGSFTITTVHKSRTGIDVTAVIVRLFNGTPNNTNDDTIVNLGRAKLKISKG